MDEGFIFPTAHMIRNEMPSKKPEDTARRCLEAFRSQVWEAAKCGEVFCNVEHEELDWPGVRALVTKALEEKGFGVLNGRGDALVITWHTPK